MLERLAMSLSERVRVGRVGRRIGLFFTLCACALLPARDARAEDKKKACAQAYEQAQELRKGRKLRGASEQLSICSQKECPFFVRKQCTQWDKDVKAAIPSVVFDVRDAISGEALSGARVLMNGKVLKDPVDEHEVEVDPGDHVLRYELPGAEPIEQTISVSEGERAKKISVLFDRSASQNAQKPPPPPAVGGPPVLSFVFGGLGIAGLGMFTTFAILGLGERNELRDTCAPMCSEDQVSSVKTKFLVADISLGVGIASIGAAAFFLLTAPSEPRENKSSTRPMWFGAAPQKGGGALVFGARF